MQHLFAAAEAVLEANFNRSFTKPAPGLYPHQWNWDAGFIALGLAHLDWHRAVAEMRHLFTGQWTNGFLPHIVFGDDPEARYFPGPDFWQTAQVPAAPRQPATSGISQPPIHGQVIWRLFQQAPSQEEGMALLEEFYPKILQLHQYYYQFRDPKEEGLVLIRHPWEAGTDNSPYWDGALARISIDPNQLPSYQRKDLQNPQAASHRPTQYDYDRYVYLVDLFRRCRYDEEQLNEVCPFQIQDPLFNGVLSWSNEALIEMGYRLGEDVLEVILWNELTVHSMNEKLWNEDQGYYQAFDRVAQTPIPIPVNSGLLPLVGLVPTQEQAEAMLKHLEGPLFGGPPEQVYLCPTYSPQAEDVDYARYWRGPVWINTNWLLYQGLLRYDMKDMAARVRRDSLELLDQFGFYEYFDPRRGVAQAGYGTNQFSWSAALCLDWLAKGDEEE